jgi:O-antigen ligase
MVSSRRVSAHGSEPAQTLFVGFFGLLLGIGLLKFGNPVILDHLVETPRTVDEWRVFAWPVRFAYLGLLLAIIPALLVLKWDWRPPAPRWALVLLLAWLGCQFVAATRSIDPAATRAVLPHMAACAVCFILGQMVLSRITEPRVFWLCLVCGFMGVLGMAFDQRFGGLDATRRMILHGNSATNLPPEYLARIQSNRVFSTLVYPNALAGAVLLVLPMASVKAWQLGYRRGTWGGRLLGGAMLLAGIMVLVWSGSKAGWLLALAAGLFLLFHSALSRRAKIVMGLTFLCAGLAAFGYLYAERLSRGATSVAARFDYWTAALAGVQERPVLGQGPGAFKKVYSRLKRPESEMAQLAHNDYLQQAVDSGWPGFVAYAGFVGGAFVWLYRHRHALRSPLERAVALGAATWFAQGMVEFGLYIPATAWCAFTFLGWSIAQSTSSQVAPTVGHAGSRPARALFESPESG